MNKVSASITREIVKALLPFLFEELDRSNAKRMRTIVRDILKAATPIAAPSLRPRASCICRAQAASGATRPKTCPRGRRFTITFVSGSARNGSLTSTRIGATIFVGWKDANASPRPASRTGRASRAARPAGSAAVSEGQAAARPNVSRRPTTLTRLGLRWRCDWGFAHSRAPAAV